MPTTSRIATTQPTASADPATNGRKARALMHQAAAAHARLIHFPEGSLGFEPVVLDVDGYRFGCAICIEVNFPNSSPKLHLALNLARPWRAEATQGDIYRSRRVTDPRSTDQHVAAKGVPRFAAATVAGGQSSSMADRALRIVPRSSLRSTESIPASPWRRYSFSNLRVALNLKSVGDVGLSPRSTLARSPTNERCRERMTSQILAALIGALGALSGVVTGSLLSAGYQRRAAAREQVARSSDERRKVFAAFLTAAREWRALSVHPNTELVIASAISSKRHADGGTAATRVLGLRSEIALVARPETIRAAYALVRAYGELAEGRGEHSAGNLPLALFVACRSAEARFTAAAREELGFAASEAELTEIFLSATQIEQVPKPSS